jgi:hypothetical protein
MIVRYAIVIVSLLAAGPALSEGLTADEARRFVTDRLFAFSCFDGSRGTGRIYDDGSVIGTIQFQGSGPIRSVRLPAGSVRVKGEAVCASIKGTIDSCFDLSRIDDQSFRGSLSGLDFAYCDFTRGANIARPALAGRNGGRRTRPSDEMNR